MANPDRDRYLLYVLITFCALVSSTVRLSVQLPGMPDPQTLNPTE